MKLAAHNDYDDLDGAANWVCTGLQSRTALVRFQPPSDRLQFSSPSRPIEIPHWAFSIRHPGLPSLRQSKLRRFTAELRTPRPAPRTSSFQKFHSVHARPPQLATTVAKMQPEHLQKLVTLAMPFGKYKGRLLADLPCHYLAWFAREGFPKGELGTLLALMYELDHNALRPLLDPLRQR